MPTCAEGFRYQGFSGETYPDRMAGGVPGIYETEGLPPARRTVLCVYAAVRGVGGIDSWGAEVEPAYQIDAEKDIEFSFRIIGA